MLKNNGDGSIRWKASVDAPWVDVSRRSGKLAAQATVELEVRLGPEAARLDAGNHVGLVCFLIDGNESVSASRTVACSVVDSPYSEWTNGPSPDPDFFPIGVWLQDPSLATSYQAMGINTYVGLWQGPTGPQLDVLKSAKMPVVTAQNQTGLTHTSNSVIEGWSHVDEPDNAQWNGIGYGPPIPPATIISAYKQMKLKDDSRPVALNFGPGVANEQWVGRGVRTGHLEDYPEYMKGADIVSFDIYPVTASDPAVKGKLEFVAKGVGRLVAWAGGKKIVWNFIECTHIKSLVMPTPAEVKAEVWMSLIHGSMGIVYFVHEWKPSFKANAVLSYPAMVQAITDINAQIRSLARVLNSPTDMDGATVRSTNPAVPVAVMTKRRVGTTYVFAVAMRRSWTTGSFEVPGLPRAARAEALGEHRIIQVTNGKFEDGFGPYGVHIYEIR